MDLERLHFIQAKCAVPCGIRSKDLLAIIMIISDLRILLEFPNAIAKIFNVPSSKCIVL